MTGNLAPPQQLCRPFRTALPSRVEDALFLGGFCFLFKRAAAQGTGLLDERFVWGWEDMDYCLRLRQAGQRLVLARDVFVRHAGSRTLRTMPALKRKRLDMRNRRLILEKWADCEPWGRELEGLMAQLPAPWHPHRPKVSVLVICWGESGAGRAALRSLRRFGRDPGCEVLAVAAGGESRAYAHLESFREDWPELKVLGPGKDASYGAAVNRGAARAKGDYLVICDGRTTVRAGWLKSLLRAALSRPDVGVVRSGRTAGGWGEACLLIPRPVFELAGGFDERFAGTLGAADYCARALQAGFCLVEDDGGRIRGGRGVPPSEQDRGLAAQKWLAQEWLWKNARLPDILRPAASVIVLCRSSWREAERCLESVRSHAGSDSYEVLAAALNGDPATCAGLRTLAGHWPQLRALGPWDSVSCARGINLAARAARGENLVILEEGVVASRGWLNSLLRAAQSRPDAGVVRAKRTAGGRSDACLLVPRRVFERVGGFDERFAGTLGAVDYCARALQEGFSLVEADGCRLRQSRGVPPSEQDRGLAAQKWLAQELQEPLWKEALLPDGLRPAASVIVLCRDSWQDAKRCLDSLRSTCGDACYEVLAASLRRERQTSAGLRDLARTWPQLRVLGPWAGESPAQGLNLAARSARGDHLVILRDDLVVPPGWLERLVATARAHPAAGVLAPACQAADLAWQKPGQSAHARPARYVRDHCLLIPRQVLTRVGDFDERFRSSLWAEDFCFRVWQKGLEVLVTDQALVRRPGRRRDQSRPPRHDLKLLFHKWAGHASLDLQARR